MILTLVLIAILASPFASQMYINRMKTTLKGTKAGYSATSRLYLWQAGLMIFKDNPFIGTGLMSFPYEKLKYKSNFIELDAELYNWLFNEKTPLVAHNTFITFLAECGIIGALPYFLLYMGTFRLNRKIKKEIHSSQNYDRKLEILLIGIESGIWGNLVCNLFINANFVVFPYVQIVVASIVRRHLKSSIEKNIQMSNEISGEGKIYSLNKKDQFQEVVR